MLLWLLYVRQAFFSKEEEVKPTRTSKNGIDGSADELETALRTKMATLRKRKKKHQTKEDEAARWFADEYGNTDWLSNVSFAVQPQHQHRHPPSKRKRGRLAIVQVCNKL